MNYYFDTSSLIKNYIDESGSEIVKKIFDMAEIIFVSELCIIECFSTLKRILTEKLISEKDYNYLKKEIRYDFNYFTIIDIELILSDCEEIIDKYQLKTLDSIQLASLMNIKNEIDSFVCCDLKLIEAAKKEKISIINPTIEL